MPSHLCTALPLELETILVDCYKILHVWASQKHITLHQINFTTALSTRTKKENLTARYNIAYLNRPHTLVNYSWVKEQLFPWTIAVWEDLTAHHRKPREEATKTSWMESSFRSFQLPFPILFYCLGLWKFWCHLRNKNLCIQITITTEKTIVSQLCVFYNNEHFNKYK